MCALATFGQRLRVDDLNVLCVGTACGNLGGTRTEWGALTPMCGGDSGGPALDDSGRVMGVASRGNAVCDSALYGTVSSWKSLIVDTAIDAATSGGYSPPSWTGGTPMDAGPPMDSGTQDSGTREPDSGLPEPPEAGTDPGPIIGERCDDVCGGGDPNAAVDGGGCGRRAARRPAGDAWAFALAGIAAWFARRRHSTRGEAKPAADFGGR